MRHGVALEQKHHALVNVLERARLHRVAHGRDIVGVHLRTHGLNGGSRRSVLQRRAEFGKYFVKFARRARRRGVRLEL